MIESVPDNANQIKKNTTQWNKFEMIKGEPYILTMILRRMISNFEEPFKHYILAALNLEDKSRLFDEKEFFESDKQLRQKHRLTEIKNFVRAFKNIYYDKWRNCRIKDFIYDKTVFINWKRYLNNLFKSQKIYSRQGVKQLFFYNENKNGYSHYDLKQIIQVNRKIMLDYIFSKQLAANLSTGNFLDVNRPGYLISYLKLGHKLALSQIEVSEDCQEWVQDQLIWIYKNYFPEIIIISPQSSESSFDLSESQIQQIPVFIKRPSSDMEPLLDKQDMKRQQNRNRQHQHNNESNLGSVKNTQQKNTNDTTNSRKQPHVRINSKNVSPDSKLQPLQKFSLQKCQSNRGLRSKSI